MSALLASAAFAATVVSNCSWNSPGRHPYTGTPAEAVSRYSDIPEKTRAQLVSKISSGALDDSVIITRDRIEGKTAYEPRITSMHFGKRTMCDQVTRERWEPTRREAASVYCVDSYCIVVPKICGNISRLTPINSAGGGAQSTVASQGAGRLSMRSGTPINQPGQEIDVETTDAIAELASVPATKLSSSTGDLGAPYFSPWQNWNWPNEEPIHLNPPTYPVSTVSEPSMPLMLVSGVALIALRWRRR